MHMHIARRRNRSLIADEKTALMAPQRKPTAPLAQLHVHAAVNIEAFRQVYMGRLAVPLSEKLAAEWQRYADFLGFGNLKVPLFGSVPLRLQRTIEALLG